MIGVMMNGSSEMKITGPRRARTALLTTMAMTSPSPMTSGSVMKVKLRVKRSAL